MKPLTLYIKHSGWAAWLGGSLACNGLIMATWQFYLIIIPVFLLEHWSHQPDTINNK